MFGPLVLFENFVHADNEFDLINRPFLLCSSSSVPATPLSPSDFICSVTPLVAALRPPTRTWVSEENRFLLHSHASSANSFSARDRQIIFLYALMLAYKRKPTLIRCLAERRLGMDLWLPLVGQAWRHVIWKVGGATSRVVSFQRAL